MTRVVASIEARMASTRFPGKVLSDIAGQPVLTRILRRLRLCDTLDDIVLATTTNPLDNAIVDWATASGIALYRGSEDDVLGRVLNAHEKMGSDVVVEICGDMPLLDPAVIDMAVSTFLTNDCDIVSTTRVPSFPQGADAEVFALENLREIAARAKSPEAREHVTLAFHQQPEQYRTIHLAAPPRWRCPHQRLLLDYHEDRSFIAAIYRRLEPDYGDRFGIDEILSLLAREPEIAQINQGVSERIPS